MPITIGNRVTEKDIRNWLDGQGCLGHSAKISDLELHAIQRPGWVQVFRFHVRVKFHPISSFENERETGENQTHERYGVVLDDERIGRRDRRTQIWMFEDEEEQKKKLNSVSGGFLTCRPAQNGELKWCLGVLMLVLAVAGIVSQFSR